MNALHILMIGVATIGVGLGAFGHSIVVARKTSMLGDWEADLEGRELRLTITPPATSTPRAVGRSIVKPRDVDPNAPIASEPEPTRRQRAYRFVADAYPTLAHAARNLSEPVPVVLVPGRPQDTRPLADALAGNARPYVGAHATADGWT